MFRRIPMTGVEFVEKDKEAGRQHKSRAVVAEKGKAAGEQGGEFG